MLRPPRSDDPTAYVVHRLWIMAQQAPKRRPRWTYRAAAMLRIRLRTLMIAVAIIAASLGLLAERSARLSRRASASVSASVFAHQREVTLEELGNIRMGVYREAHREVMGPTVPVGGGYGRAAKDDRNWWAELEVKFGQDEGRPPLVRLKTEGGWDGIAHRPIVITDFGAPYNGGAIQHLIAVYGGRGWAYRVVPAAGVAGGSTTGGPDTIVVTH